MANKAVILHPDVVWDIPEPSMNNIVPGDLIMTNGHATIVSYLKYNQNSKNIGYSEIYVLEAASWDSDWYVMKRNNWTRLNKTTDYNAYRLIIE